jgi:HK97 family phage prohead protease
MAATEPALLGKELCGSVYANPPSDRVKPLTDDREISREELAVLCATLPAGPSKPVLVEHDPNKQVGVITAMFQAPQSGTTYARFKLFDTPEGRQTHQQIEAGRLRGLSLGTDWKRQPGLSTRDVKLRELSVCTEGYRPDTGVFNASKDAQANGAVDFVSLPPVNQPIVTMDSTPQQQPQAPQQPQMQQPQQQMMQQQPQQQQQQPMMMSGSFNAAAQTQAPPNYSYAAPQQQQQQAPQPYLPFNMTQSAQTQPPAATVSWSQFAHNPAQYFQPQQQKPQVPNEQYHFMNMHQMPVPQMPYGFQQTFYPPSQLAPPPYMQQQQQLQQQPQQQLQQQQPAAPAPTQQGAAPALPPGLKRHGKRTASQVQAEDEESDEKNPGGTEKDGSGDMNDSKTEEKKASSVKFAEKKQETETAAKLLPIPETESQIDKVINAILATPGMSKDEKAANIRALSDAHRQLKALHEEKRNDVLSRLDHVEKVLARSGFTNNPTFERLRREAADPSKFKTVIEEANSMLAMLEHNTGQSIAPPLNVNALAAPADGLQAALNEWRTLSAPPGMAQHVPQMGTVNASAKSQQSSTTPAFPLPRHDANPHGITTVSGQPVVPLYTHERPLFDKPLPRIIDPSMGTINLRG